MLLASHVSSLGAAVTLIAIARLFAFMAPQAWWSLLQEIVPRDRVRAGWRVGALRCGDSRVRDAVACGHAVRDAV
ncbi:hypothetical protein L2Y90_32540 (plasmid) [Burkholderia pyrrocinia]|uniref:hypothetical protein n=1 Tax=Burkholderia pyrrocinia TaxID=60550 RepID=UPI00215B53D0|nr:hypothetical protein [Burkholderia pyrrocinia]UVE70549.1 hypothetical protein L2Y90_32540 [Burkholderia pyrrocinia]